nr:hypothetical protein HK105_007314 [Polyrhizophydium stewartii]
MTGTISKSDGNKQVLDTLKVERERGITVKAQTASMFYTHNGQEYLLNLIDTPGHVDFSYEVSRSLAACQGTLLLVDACQGIQAQTIANFYLAFGEGLTILPVLNKVSGRVDLPAADPERIAAQIQSTFEMDVADTRNISAKSGQGVAALFGDIIERIPPPEGSVDKPFRALLFDTWYDKYVGVVCLIAVHDGVLKKGDRIVSAHTKQMHDITDIGIMYPHPTSAEQLSAGQVGFVTMNMKTTHDAHIGDTFYHEGVPTEVFKGFHPARSMVFAGLYPIDTSEYNKLAESLDRLTLNDSSVSVTKETSSSLGQGFRLGFLGTLHMDVFRQRLEEEHDATVINTAPTVPYIVQYSDGSETSIRNPAEFPDPDDFAKIKALLEPMVIGTLVFPSEYLGKMMELCERHRGEQIEYNFIDDNRVLMKYRLPMSEILSQFYDQLKSLSSGYASFDYEEAGYAKSDLVKVNILLNSKPVDALATIVHRSQADHVSKDWTRRLKGVLKKQLFDIVIQASVNGKIVARETLSAARKDVTAKCYGGDITRKMKLLEKQKAGKKRMKMVAGGVELPQEAFLTLMKGEDEPKKNYGSDSDDPYDDGDHEEQRGTPHVPIVMPTLFTVGFVVVSFGVLSTLEADRRLKEHREAQARSRSEVESLLGSIGLRWGDRGAGGADEPKGSGGGSVAVGFKSPTPEFLVNIRDIIRDRWRRMTSAEQTTAAIIGVNTAVFLAWQIPALGRFMSTHFLRRATSSRSYTLLTSAFSHHSLLHLAFNMIALNGFFNFVQLSQRMSPEEAVFFYTSAAVTASFGSHLVTKLMPVAMRAGAASLGASGAVWAVLAAATSINPEMRASIIFIPGTSLPLGDLVFVLMALDLAGLVLRWRTFDHAAHLAGALAGFAYANYGLAFWSNTQHDLQRLEDERQRVLGPKSSR